MAKSNIKQIITDDFLTLDQLKLIYKKDNILIERLELYYDFCYNFFTRIHDSYLGKDFIKTDKQKLSFFNWAFEKTCDEFNTIDFDFSINNEIRKYLNTHINEQIYNNNDYNEEFLLYDLEYIERILKFDSNKTKKDLLLTYDLYSKFDLIFK